VGELKLNKKMCTFAQEWAEVSENFKKVYDKNLK
jgi:hypothetical protein